MYGTLQLCQFFSLFPGHLSRNVLLEQNGAETRVESTETLGSGNLAETTNQTAGKGGLADETDAGGLERAEGNIGEEFCGGGRGEVDGGAVVGGRLVAELVDPLLLEELVAAELERALEEVAGEGRADTREQGAGALVGDDLAEAADQAAVVCDGVELDAGLDAGNGMSVRDRASLGVLPYTSTGVRAPWVTEQQTAPARANLE